uniref:Fizzy-related protein homolog n=1 Tax=Nilaparvata lugens TaxID=108931 RepID=M9PLJ4_NILLU|nr:fizzy-related protein [Nilaparvata lugens]
MDRLSMDVEECEMNPMYAKRLIKQTAAYYMRSVKIRPTMSSPTTEYEAVSNKRPLPADLSDTLCDMDIENVENVAQNLTPAPSPVKKDSVERWLMDCNAEKGVAEESEKVTSQQVASSAASQADQLSISSRCFDFHQSTMSKLTAKLPRELPVADRYIPARGGASWQTRFSLIPEGRLTSVTAPKKSRETSGSGGAGGGGGSGGGSGGGGESNRDGLAYTCLLRNELLGANIEGVKGQCDERRAVSEPERNNLFQYMTHVENEQNIESIAPYSLSPVGPKSQKLLRSPRRATRKISRIPFKVLDAPELQDDFYLNLVDWSSQNVLSVGLGSCVYLWSACTSQVTRLCDLSNDANSVTSVAWNERGNLVAVGTHTGYVQVWDVAVSKQVNKLMGHSARVGALAWNGDMLSSGSRDRMILQRDIRTPQMVAERRLVGHRQEVCGLKWSPDNQYLASGGNDNRLYVWNMHSLSPLQTYTEHLAAVKAIAWSPHHHGLLASGGGTADRCIRFWNTLTGQPMQCVDTGSQVCNLAWSKHSSELVSTHGYSQNQILVWKYPTLTQVAKLTGHSYRVLYLAMSPDGEAIVTGAGDETLRFWNVFSKVRSQKESKSVLNLFSNIR